MQASCHRLQDILLQGFLNESISECNVALSCIDIANNLVVVSPVLGVGAVGGKQYFFMKNPQSFIKTC